MRCSRWLKEDVYLLFVEKYFKIHGIYLQFILKKLQSTFFWTPSINGYSITFLVCTFKSVMKFCLKDENFKLNSYKVHVSFKKVSSGTRAKFGLNLLRPASNWPQVQAAGDDDRTQKMAPTQVTSSNKTVVAKMFWMVRPAPIVKPHYNRLKPHNTLILEVGYLSKGFVFSTWSGRTNDLNTHWYSIVVRVYYTNKIVLMPYCYQQSIIVRVWPQQAR